MKLQLFLDCDGVLVDFETGVHNLFQELVQNKPDLIKQAIEAKTKMSLTGPLPAPQDFLKKPEYKSIMWKFVSYAIQQGFWNRLDPMPDMQTLWGFCQQFRPSIITAPLQSMREETCKQKKAWVDKFLGLGNIDQFHCVPANEKQQFVVVSPDIVSVLIDDKPANIERWNSAGGTGIFHTSAESSISQLKDLLTKVGIIAT